MKKLSADTTITEYQNYIGELFGPVDRRYFSNNDMVINMSRFVMRGIKGIRKGDADRTVHNLLIALGWYMELLNQLGISIEGPIWKRFPYMCSYCGEKSCQCKIKKVQTRKKLNLNASKRPETLQGYQDMFEIIYPRTGRTLEHAGVHLAEEVGEVAEAFLAFRGTHNDTEFDNLVSESADLFSCVMGVFNSLERSVADELEKHYRDHCPQCKKGSCECSFHDMLEYR